MAGEMREFRLASLSPEYINLLLRSENRTFPRPRPASRSRSEMTIFSLYSTIQYCTVYCIPSYPVLYSYRLQYSTTRPPPPVRVSGCACVRDGIILSKLDDRETGKPGLPASTTYGYPVLLYCTLGSK